MNILFDYVRNSHLEGNFVRLQNFDFLDHGNFDDLNVGNFLGVMLVDSVIRILSLNISVGEEKSFRNKLMRKISLKVLLHIMMSVSAPAMNRSEPRGCDERKNLKR